jgi:predicted AAA+ superfamily ATPase
MEIKRREAEKYVRSLARGYPVIIITGPRQSGKTTLARRVFKSKQYVSLENPDTREFAASDPRGFLETYSKGAILDEVQRCPKLFSYLQEIIDEKPVPGRFIKTGSGHFSFV